MPWGIILTPPVFLRGLLRLWESGSRQDIKESTMRAVALGTPHIRYDVNEKSPGTFVPGDFYLRRVTSSMKEPSGRKHWNRKASEEASSVR